MKQQAISLVGFSDYDEVASYIDAYPQAKFELAYNMSSDFLEQVEPLLQGRVVSVHACSPLEPWFPNFGSEDAQVIRESDAMMMRTAQTALRFGASIVVLHPGYVTNSRVSSNYEGRKALMKSSEFFPLIGREEGYIARHDILECEQYRHHFSIMANHIKGMSRQFQELGLTLAVENLNPRAGYLFMQPQEMQWFAPELHFCLDVGHLWISHFVFGFDFLQAVKAILESGRVVSMHLHSNPSDGNVLEDSHQDIDKNGFPIADVLRLAKFYPVNLVLETVSHPVANSQLLDILVNR